MATYTDRTAQGLTLNVYRDSRPDCTNGGMTATADRVTLIGILDPDTGTLTAMPRGARVLTASPDAPPAVLTWHPQHTREFLTARGHTTSCYIIDAHQITDTHDNPGRYRAAHSMMGGNFAHTSDSRLRETIAAAAPTTQTDGPLAVHDRTE